MLTIVDGHRPVSRRRFLPIGSLGLGGLSLPSLLAGRASAGQSASSLTGKSVIFLFQQGGPSQLETFDPKVEAPAGVRTVTDVVQTSLPGVTFGSTMSRLSRLAHKLAVVRSFQTNNGGHNIRPIVGPDSLETNIGSHYARIAGVTQPATGMPTNALLFPQAVDHVASEPHGLITFDVPQGVHEIELRLGSTNTARIANWISLASWLAFVIVLPANFLWLWLSLRREED